MTKLSWPKAKAYEAGRRSLLIQRQLDGKLQRQATSARQMAAQAYRTAADVYQAWRCKLAAEPHNRLLQAIVGQKYRLRKAAYEHWTEAKQDQIDQKNHRTSRF